MNDLSQHLAPNASHARLPFHPRCPLCCDERLLGVTHIQPAVSCKLGLGAAAAMLLLAPALPAVAAAAPAPLAPPVTGEPDSESEGSGQGDPSPGQDEDRPGSDVDGLDSDQVEENSPPLVAPEDDSKPDGGENESGPLELTPPPDENAVPEQQGGAPVPVAPSAPGHQAPAPREEAPSQDDAGRGARPGEESSTWAPAAEPGRDPSSRTDRSRSRGRHKVARPDVGQGSTTNLPSSTRPQSVVPLDPTSPDRDGATTPDHPGDAGGSGKAPAAQSPDTRSTSDPNVHIVQSGDTLWAIATAHLGGSPTPAEVAREVERLWNLNANAIGTGDPDLLLVGQKLRMR